MTSRKKTSVRKIRSDCKMNQLTAAQRNAVFKASETRSTEDLAAMIAQKYGVKISATAVGNWLRAERIVRKASDTVAVARHVVETLRECGENGDIDAAIEALAKERAFDALTQDADIAEIAALVRLVNENKRILLSSRRIDVYERRANLGVAEDEKKAKKLTPEEALALIREKFGWKKA